MKNRNDNSNTKSRKRSSRRTNKGANIKPWVITAINNESRKSPERMWKNEPPAAYQKAERLKRIRFLRRHEKADPELKSIADCLDECDQINRCYSGACPECGRLFQRFYVRRSKGAMRDIIAPEGHQLVALSIIPWSGLVRPGQMSKFDIAQYQRQIKSILDSVRIKSAIGGIDISFNEDHENKWRPYISLHPYLIVATNDKEKLRRALRRIIPTTDEVPRPINVANIRK